MVKAAEIIQLMGQIAPASLAEDWDNVGLQVGNPAKLNCFGCIGWSNCQRKRRLSYGIRG